MTRSRIGLLAVAAAASLWTSSAVMADTMLVDRGLPTANLNNAAGASRSNVAWADFESSATPSEYWLAGDDFTVGGSGSYQVNTIRVWTIDSSAGLSLVGGADGGAMSLLSNSYTATPVTYVGGQIYEGSAARHEIFQLDFAVNMTVNAGQTVDFFLDGPFNAGSGGFLSPYLHASNAALSGSPQDGSDDTFKWLHVNGGQVVETWNSGTGTGTSGFSAGWDKASDGNVQVFGSAVPLPSSALGGLTLLGGLALRTRRARR
jgi:hypothetical protein